MTPYTMASFSGGKDSTAMVLRMIERGDRLDEVVFCDTGMEFPSMYGHVAEVREAVEAAGVRFTALRNPEGFVRLLCEKPVPSRKYGEHPGYGWPRAYARWCTKHLKQKPMAALGREREAEFGEVQWCDGLAFDEGERILRRQNAGKRHPLTEWGWTEADALRYCCGRGFDWDGLYRHFPRTSCYCCPLQPLSSLRTLRREYPELWENIGRLEARTQRTTNPTFKPLKSWADLEERFAREEGAE